VNLDHSYAVSVEWTGNRGTGTSAYRAYGREVAISAEGKTAPIDGSADPVFFGDAERWNPEELLLASLSECHLLSYLYVAARQGIIVERYVDNASGTIEQTDDGGGRFTEAVLRPLVHISAGDPHLALELHAEASAICFIASSVNFPIRHEPTILVLDDPRS
jgi:organic hydroperoxide reductase OsmC/OhrA